MELQKMYLLIGLLAVLSISISCDPELPEKSTQPIEKPLWGSWKVASIHWVTKDTVYSIEKAQPGLLMINSSRYSIMWTPIEESRTPFKALSKPTEEETIAGFRSVVFNAGTYEMTDSTLTTTAVIAKVPGFEGGKQFYRYKLEADQLELTMFDETYPDGTKPEWYGRYETKFILRRVD